MERVRGATWPTLEERATKRVAATSAAATSERANNLVMGELKLGATLLHIILFFL
jgi:hypothetical protein